METKCMMLSRAQRTKGRVLSAGMEYRWTFRPSTTIMLSLSLTCQAMLSQLHSMSFLKEKRLSKPFFKMEPLKIRVFLRFSKITVMMPL